MDRGGDRRFTRTVYLSQSDFFGTVELVLVAGQNSRRYCSNMNQSSKVTSGEVVWRIDAITVNIVKGIGSLFGLSFGFIYIKYIMG